MQVLGVCAQNPRRYIVLRVPDWALVSLGQLVPPGTCAVTVSHGRVVEMTLKARQAGIHVGMRVSSAQLLVRELVILPTDVPGEAQRFTAVLEAMETQVAYARSVSPGVAWTFARGPAAWHGSEELAAEALVDAVAVQLGVESNVGIATGTLAALWAAAQGHCVPDGDERSYVEPVVLEDAIAVLPGGETRYGALVRQLSLLGVRTCRDVCSCDRDAFFARFGRCFDELYVLCSGGDLFFPDGQREIEQLQAEYHCEGHEASVERLMIPLTRLAGELSHRLAVQAVNAGSLVTRFVLENGKEFERRWGAIDAQGHDAIAQRLLWHLQGIISQKDAGKTDIDSGIECIAVIACDLSEVLADTPLWGGVKNDEARRRAIERVHSLLGDQSVLRVQERGGFDPRHRMVLRPWGEELKVFPPVCGGWEGQVSDPPQVICVPPVGVTLRSVEESESNEVVEEDENHSGATIIPFPGMCVTGGNTRAEQESLYVDRYGQISSYRAQMILLDAPDLTFPLPWKKHHSVEVTLRDPIWSVRGRWWENTARVENRARSYVRARTEGGAELLLMYCHKEWVIEGVYDRG